MADLDRVSREGGKDFRIELEGAPHVFCEEVVRRLPGRRLVCRGTWQGRPVFAKVFIGRKARRYAARDAQGARALARHGLLTPELLHEGSIAHAGGQALIYALVAESQDAETLWQASSEAARMQLAQALVTLVAHHHAAGLLQTDLYLRNFLCTDAGLYTLDGDGIRLHRRPLGKRKALANLALLLSKFGVAEDRDLQEWLRQYLAARGWGHDAIGLRELACAVRAQRRKVALDYAYKKMLRNCSEVRVERDFRHFQALMRLRESQDVRRILEDPDHWLEPAHCLRLKSGNTCTVGQVHSDARDIVIKRYNIKNLGHALSRGWRPTRAAASWSNAHLLRIYGIDTPQPLALLERRWGGWRREGYFLAEFAAGPDIAEALAAAAADEEKQAIARQAAQLLRKLYLLQVEHGDFKASNLKLVAGKPMLLDLDAMRQHRWDGWFRRRHARDLRRFLKNWHNAPDIQRMLKSALKMAYGNDPVLTLAGIEETSE